MVCIYLGYKLGMDQAVVAKQDLFLNSNNRDQLRVRSTYTSELSTSDSLNKKITRELEEKTELQTLNWLTYPAKELTYVGAFENAQIQ